MGSVEVKAYGVLWFLQFLGNYLNKNYNNSSSRILVLYILHKSEKQLAVDGIRKHCHFSREPIVQYLRFLPLSRLLTFAMFVCLWTDLQIFEAVHFIVFLLVSAWIRIHRLFSRTNWKIVIGKGSHFREPINWLLGKYPLSVPRDQLIAGWVLIVLVNCLARFQKRDLANIPTFLHIGSY